MQGCSPAGPLRRRRSPSSPCSCRPCLWPSPSLSVSLLPGCQEEASKLRFLASIRRLCRACLQGRYLLDFLLARELLETVEVRGCPWG